MKAILNWRRGWTFATLTALFLWPLWCCAGNATNPAIAEGPALQFVTEELPPLNFNNNGQVDGFGSEIVREILRRSDMTAPLTILPWARAYRLAQTQSNVGLYCMGRTIEREKLFQWVGPIGNIESKFYVNRSSTLHIDNVADAKNVRGVIVLRESYSDQLLQRLGFKNIFEVNNATEAVRLLLISGDKTLMLLATSVVPDTLHKISTPLEAIKPLMTVMKSQLYIGFSLDTSPTLVKHLQHALDSMKTDGSFAAIHQKWFPGEKPPGMEREQDIMPPN
jgi:polar amino acid transport system substrate-binding protein